MILIADSGSTKADWACGRKTSDRLSTQGISPIHQSEDTIRQILYEELLPQLDAKAVTNVYFYGSGITPDREPLMVRLLKEVFPMATVVEAYSDLLGAARAICGHNEGIACILGTGANSCLYDGERIVKNTPALGYILGDEGSGAVLGRSLIHSIYKGILSEKIKSYFESETGLTLQNVIEAVYRKPLPNRFLASLAPFIHRHIDDQGIRSMVVGCFNDFFRKNITPYVRKDLQIGFVGSIAYFFAAELRESARQQGYVVGDILRSPIEGLLNYYNQDK